MPKKVVKKATKKVVPKVTKKVAVNKVVVKKAPAKKVAAKKSVVKQSELDVFYAKHPNIKPLLILLLLVSAAVLIYLFKLQSELAMTY